MKSGTSEGTSCSASSTRYDVSKSKKCAYGNKQLFEMVPYISNPCSACGFRYDDKFDANYTKLHGLPWMSIIFNNVNFSYQSCNFESSIYSHVHCSLVHTLNYQKGTIAKGSSTALEGQVSK